MKTLRFSLIILLVVMLIMPATLSVAGICKEEIKACMYATAGFHGKDIQSLTGVNKNYSLYDVKQARTALYICLINNNLSHEEAVYLIQLITDKSTY